jgi:hypothetical protein
VVEAIIQFQSQNLIVATGEDVFRTTERGRKLVEMLCQTPLPEHKWADPRESK